VTSGSMKRLRRGSWCCSPNGKADAIPGSIELKLLE
jgi:hypothetical protein